MKEILKYFKGDVIIWFVVGLLLMLSILSIYSTSSTISYLQTHSAASFAIKRVILACVCLGGMLILSNINYAFFTRLSGIILVASFVLLLIVYFGGTSINGSKRWIVILGFTIQPSEFVKVGLIMTVCRFLSLYQTDLGCSDRGFKAIFWISNFVCASIAYSDFSTSVLLYITIFILCYVGRVRKSLLFKYYGIIIASGLIFAIAITILPVKLPGRLATIQNRMMSFTGNNENKESESTYNYQIEQSKIAIVTGGYTGRGPGNSIQRNFLPLPFSDFVYAAIIEEFGMLVGIGVIILYVILMYRAGILVKKSSWVFPALLTLGLMIGIVFQAFVNIGVSLGVVPITGQPLPLVSKGGSSLLATCFSLGMILNITYSLGKEDSNDPSINEEDNKQL